MPIGAADDIIPSNRLEDSLISNQAAWFNVSKGHYYTQERQRVFCPKCYQEAEDYLTTGQSAKKADDFESEVYEGPIFESHVIKPAYYDKKGIPHYGKRIMAMRMNCSRGHHFEKFFIDIIPCQERNWCLTYKEGSPEESYQDMEIETFTDQILLKGGNTTAKKEDYSVRGQEIRKQSDII